MSQRKRKYPTLPVAEERGSFPPGYSGPHDPFPPHDRFRPHPCFHPAYQQYYAPPRKFRRRNSDSELHSPRHRRGRSDSAQIHSPRHHHRRRKSDSIIFERPPLLHHSLSQHERFLPWENVPKRRHSFSESSYGTETTGTYFDSLAGTYNRSLTTGTTKSLRNNVCYPSLSREVRTFSDAPVSQRYTLANIFEGEEEDTPSLPSQDPTSSMPQDMALHPSISIATTTHDEDELVDNIPEKRLAETAFDMGRVAEMREARELHAREIRGMMRKSGLKRKPLTVHDSLSFVPDPPKHSLSAGPSPSAPLQKRSAEQSLPTQPSRGASAMSSTNSQSLRGAIPDLRERRSTANSSGSFGAAIRELDDGEGTVVDEDLLQLEDEDFQQQLLNFETSNRATETDIVTGIEESMKISVEVDEASQDASDALPGAAEIRITWEKKPFGFSIREDDGAVDGIQDRSLLEAGLGVGCALLTVNGRPVLHDSQNITEVLAEALLPITIVFAPPKRSKTPRLAVLTQRVGARSGASIPNGLSTAFVLIDEADEIRPCCYSQIVARSPGFCLCLWMLLLAVICLVDVLHFAFQEQHERMYLIEGEKDVKRYDAVYLAKLNAEISPNGIVDFQTDSVEDFRLSVMFESDGNILTADAFNEIRRVESYAIAEAGWPDLCLRSSLEDSGCSQRSHVSLLSNLPDPITQEALDGLLTSINRTSIAFHFGKGFIDSGQSNIYRSFFEYGLPYPKPTGSDRYISRNDRYDEQEEKYNKYISPVYRNIVLKSSSLDAYAIGIRAIIVHYLELVSGSMIWALCSCGAVFLFMWFHLNSLFLAATGIFLEVLMSFPVGYFFFRIICNITWFDTMQLTVFFIVLGVGADDIFVFTDAWLQSQSQLGLNLEKRVQYTLSRSFKAIMVTSFTTFFAFLATALSPIVPIRAFGIWAAWVVLSDFILVITVFPCVIVLWERYFNQSGKKVQEILIQDTDGRDIFQSGRFPSTDLEVDKPCTHLVITLTFSDGTASAWTNQHEPCTLLSKVKSTDRVALALLQGENTLNIRHSSDGLYTFAVKRSSAEAERRPPLSTTARRVLSPTLTLPAERPEKRGIRWRDEGDQELADKISVSSYESEAVTPQKRTPMMIRDPLPYQRYKTLVDVKSAVTSVMSLNDFASCIGSDAEKGPEEMLAAFDVDPTELNHLYGIERAALIDEAMQHARLLEGDLERLNTPGRRHNRHDPMQTVADLLVINELMPSKNSRSKSFGLVGTCMGKYWSAFVYKFQFSILIAFTIVVGFATYQASKLSPLTSSEEWFVPGHYITKANDLVDDFTVAEADNVVKLDLAWGINGIDRGGTDPWDPDDYGVTQYDSSFDISPPDNQQFIFDACQDLKNNYGFRLATPSSVDCPLEAYAAWRAARGAAFPAVFSDDAAEQRVNFTRDLRAWYFSNDTATALSTQILKQGKLVGFIEGALKYIIIRAYTSRLEWQERSYYEREKKNWQNWIDEQNDKAPSSLKTLFMSTYQWSWQHTETELIRGAIQGVIIVLPIAGIVLLLSTHNWIISLFALLTIGCIITCTLATVVLLGWEMGLTESVVIVIMIGFSIDYVVHLANAYVEAPYDSRRYRIVFAMTTMGTSVVAGGLSSIFASIFLIPPVFSVYRKMGILILATVCYSVLFALFFFVALLSAFGPRNTSGNCGCCGSLKRVVCCMNPTRNSFLKNQSNYHGEESNYDLMLSSSGEMSQQSPNSPTL